MRNVVRSRLQEDAPIYKSMIEQIKAGVWKPKTMRNGRLVDTKDETLQNLETTLASIEADIEDMAD
jgi:hypothetical protein